jgi:hypothetical protein
MSSFHVTEFPHTFMFRDNRKVKGGLSIIHGDTSQGETREAAMAPHQAAISVELMLCTIASRDPSPLS